MLNDTIKDLVVPEQLKPEFRKVYGRLCNSPSEAAQAVVSTPSHGKVITVGDVVSYNIISAGVNPDIVVYDGMVMREKAKSWMKAFLDAYIADQKTAANPAGHITGEIWQAVFEALRAKGKCKIFVKGEEDLAVLPFVILATPGTCILYGMPNRGIDLIVVDENIKNAFKRLLKLLREDEGDESKRLKRLKEEKIREMFHNKK